MAEPKVVVLPGDGIGPEVVEQAVRVLIAVAPDVAVEERLIGGAALDAVGHPLPQETLDACLRCNAVLLGAVGGPKWDCIQPVELRPEVGGLLALRKALRLNANLRPVRTFPALAAASPLKAENALVDLVVVRELTGGIYFGRPRERREGGRVAVDTCLYSVDEVEAVAHVAFRLASQRRRRVTSVDKANVLETSRLWRETVERVSSAYPEIELEHMLVDNCAMQLVRNPRRFDVILTENLFGDVLSDEAAVLTGSLGMLPSASLRTGQGSSPFGLYEPAHGSAPDIAGTGRANPLATVLSVAMLLRTSLARPEAADRVERAVERVLDAGVRTADLAEAGQAWVGTREMGDALLADLKLGR
ncbi:MAG: 3-isopropylmalate dehydrogenase [Fimbriimonadales bacterium]|nr:3-isopropylmalate dehydrogenase [Fimbriimonadales bacterium]